MTATHSLLGVFVGVVQAWKIGPDCEHSGSGKGCGAYDPCAELLGAYGLDKECYGYAGHYKQEVVGHLYMVGCYLKHSE